MNISVTEIITICGGASAIVSGVVGFAAQRFADKRNEKWREITESNLKRLENELSEKSSIFSNLVDIQKSNYNSSQERRIKAIDRVWEKLEDLKSTISPNIPLLYNILLDQEIEDLNKDKPSDSSVFFKKQLDIIEYELFFEEINKFKKILFAERPFLGEDLWFNIEIYTSFLGRLIYKTQEGIALKKLKHWKWDDPIMNLLKTHITPEQLNTIAKNKTYSYNNITIIFENKIIDSVSNVLSGKIASDNSLNHIKILKNQLYDLEISKPL